MFAILLNASNDGPKAVPDQPSLFLHSVSIVAALVSRDGLLLAISSGKYEPVLKLSSGPSS